jgi:hypothetical protein
VYVQISSFWHFRAAYACIELQHNHLPIHIQQGLTTPWTQVNSMIARCARGCSPRWPDGYFALACTHTKPSPETASLVFLCLSYSDGQANRSRRWNKNGAQGIKKRATSINPGRMSRSVCLPNLL